MVKKISDDEAGREIAESIINTVREPLIVLDQDLRAVSANSSFYRVFQVKPEETVGQFIYDLGNGQWEIPKLRDLLETILPEKITFDNYEVEHTFANIGRRIMLLNARQIQRILGKEKVILLAIEDITERKQLEDLLAESEERFRRLFETADDGILLLEKSKFEIRYANPAVTAMLGYSNEECIGKEVKHIGFPDSFDNVQEILQRLERDDILYYNGALVQNKARQVIDTDIYLVDKAEFVQCNIRDITVRKQAEATLKESEERFHSAFEYASIGMALVSPDGHWLRVNKARCQNSK